MGKMTDDRLALHELLCEKLGSRNVYFQPPESIKMQYPCIVYKRSTGDTQFANDNPYTFRVRYQVTYIDKNPDSEIVNKMAKFKTARFIKHIVIENLNHDIFNLYL